MQGNLQTLSRGLNISFFAGPAVEKALDAAIGWKAKQFFLFLWGEKLLAYLLGCKFGPDLLEINPHLAVQCKGIQGKAMGMRQVELERWFSRIGRNVRFFVGTFLNGNTAGRHSKITSEDDAKYATTCDEMVFVARKYKALGSGGLFGRQIRRKDFKGHGRRVEGHAPDVKFRTGEGERFPWQRPDGDWIHGPAVGWAWRTGASIFQFFPFPLSSLRHQQIAESLSHESNTCLRVPN